MLPSRLADGRKQGLLWEIGYPSDAVNVTHASRLNASVSPP